MKRRWRIFVIFLVLTAIANIGCMRNQNEREFFPDITVPLEDSTGQIIIREWRWLLASGAEIYYQKNDVRTLLGKTTGGDDGYCPFQAGKYTLKTEGAELIVRWAFRGDAPQDQWREKRFLISGGER